MPKTKTKKRKSIEPAKQPLAKPKEQEQKPTGPPDTVYVSFSAEINTTTAEKLLAVCCELANKGVKTIYILLTTPGGSVMTGVNIYGVLKALPCKVVMHNVGSVDSIGNAVFLAGEERYANPEATFMFHGVGVEVNEKTRLEEKNLKEHLDTVQAGQRKIGDIVRARANFTNESEIAELFLSAATKDAEYAKNRGIIHDVRDAKVPKGATIVQLVFER